MHKEEEIINIEEEIKKDMESFEMQGGLSERQKMKDLMKVLCSEDRKAFGLFNGDSSFMNEFKRLNNFVEIEKKE